MTVVSDPGSPGNPDLRVRMWISERGFAEHGFIPNADPDNMSLVHPYLKVLSSCIRPLDESKDPITEGKCTERSFGHLGYSDTGMIRVQYKTARDGSVRD